MEKTIIKSFIDFNDNITLQNKLACDNDKNYAFRQGRTDFVLELTPINCDETKPVILDPATTKCYVFSTIKNAIVDYVPISAIDSVTGLVTITGDIVITDVFGVNLLILETELGASWNLVYEVDETKGYKSNLIPTVNSKDFVTKSDLTVALITKADKKMGNVTPIDNIMSLSENADLLQANGKFLKWDNVQKKIVFADGGTIDTSSFATKKDVASLNIKIANNTSDIAKVNSALTKNTNDIKAINTSITSLTNDKADKTTLTITDQHVSENTATLANHETRIKKLETPSSAPTPQGGITQAQLDNALKTKLDLDLGNVSDSGFIEKLDDAKVAYKSELPKNLRAPFKVEIDEIRQGESLTIDPLATFIDLNLQGDENTPFNFDLPDFTVYPKLEQLRIKLLTSQDSQTGGKRAQYVIKTAKAFGDGTSEQVYNNIKYAILDCTPDALNNRWIIEIIYNEPEENGSSDITIEDMNGDTVTTNKINLEYPLSVENHPDGSSASVGLDKRYLTNIANDGLLVSISNNVQLMPAISATEPREIVMKWNNIIKNHGAGIGTNDIAGTITQFQIQDDLADDPNVTGGQPIIIGAVIDFVGVAEDDGYIEMEIHDIAKNMPLNNQFGEPMIIRHDYKAGDKLLTMKMDLIYMALGSESIDVRIRYNFITNPLVVSDYGSSKTEFMLQMITSESKSGPASAKYEIDQNVALKIDSYYMGQDQITLDPYLQNNEPITLLNKGYNITDINIGIWSSDGVNYQIQDRYLTLDVGNKISNSGILFALTNELTHLNRIGQMNVHFDMKNENTGILFETYKWKGEIDRITTFPIKNIDADDNITYNDNWELVNSELIIPSVTFKNNMFAVDMPAVDFSNFVFVLRGQSNVTPNKFVLGNFDVDNDSNKTVYFLNEPYDKAMAHLQYTSGESIFQMTNTRFSGERYTINSRWTKYPVGTFVSGNAKINQSMFWKDSSFAGEGGFIATEDCNFKIEALRMSNSAHIGESATVNQDVKLGIAINPTDYDNPTIIQEINALNNIVISNKNYTTLLFGETKEMQVKKNDKIVVYLKTNEDDGLYIQAPQNRVLSTLRVKTTQIK